MTKLQNGNDVAVYMRNAVLALMEISRKFGIDISVCCFENGTYGRAKFGNFEITEFSGNDTAAPLELYEYVPQDVSKIFKIKPADIVFKKCPEPSKANRA